MTDEVIKLYKNAGLSNMWVEEYDDKQFWHGCYNEMIQSMMKLNDWDRKTAISVAHKECRKAHPPFTAEKQLAILQLLTQRRNLTISHFTKGEFIHFDGQEPLEMTGKDFTETFARLINVYWQSLTEEEKEQIRGILNGN